MQKKYLPYLALFLVAFFWGGSFVGIKFEVLAWPPFFSAALRMVITLFALIIFILITGKSSKIIFPLRWRIWFIGIFALGIPFATLFWGERFIAPGLAGIINSTTLIWSFLFSLILFSQDGSRRVIKIVGILFGFLGILIIFWPMLSFQETKTELLGAGAVMIMALSYAIASILNQLFFSKYGKVDLYANLLHQSASTLVFLTILSLIFEKWPSWHVVFTSYSAILGVLYLGIFSTAVAWMLYYYLIREWGAVRANLTAYLVPISALIDDFIFFRHIPLVSELIGVVIILCAIFMINGNPMKSKSISG